jgi:hypothetical protein
MGDKIMVEEICIAEHIKPFLNEIAERLWSGHAAVMVGSGFSKNAKPNGSNSPKFPDWYQLGDLFYAKIHGKEPSDSRYLNVLKLADEVQAAFGRPTLDQLLRSSIPDNYYEPSNYMLTFLNFLGLMYLQPIMTLCWRELAHQ